ncbi:MAG: hypothetical protein ACI8U3_000798 [Brevundimonas sp.]|jgi:hypothetical protein|uniref:DUF2093 domain-containing protein n=1 Tax=Brevundimonas sp. TaxID=1871086 RepID=UPI0039E472A6
MNAHDPNLDGLAQLHYGDGDYVVLKPGRFVICAVTGRQIPLDALRYWSIDLQEPYVGPGELMERAAAA